MKWSLRILAVLIAGLLVAQVVPSAQAQIKGRYRITLMNGKTVEGDVKELPDGSYEVKTKQGAIVSVRKNQVKGIVALEEGPAHPAKTGLPGVPGKPSLRREISDEEIEELVQGITATVDETIKGKKYEDMMVDLAVNEDDVKEMLRQVGLPAPSGALSENKNVLLRPHFAMVYTSTAESARGLAARLERVYEWNVKFLEMLNLPAQRPEYKLEIYYFGTFDEYEAYTANIGGPLGEGVLGYYMPSINRAHFYDLMTMPGFKELLDRLKEPDVPYEAKQFIRNKIRRMMEHGNVEVVQHETGHMIHFNIGLFPKDGLERDASVPIWLVEGTTMLFEVPPGSAGASIGRLNDTRLFELRAFFGFKPLSPELWKLVIIDNNYWFGAGGWGQGQSYPLGWGMVNYLWHKKRAGYAKYCAKVFGREEKLTPTQLEAEFVECFGVLDQKWFEDFYEYIDKLQVKPSQVDPRFEEAARAQNITRRRDYGGTKGYSGHRGQDEPPRSGQPGPGRGRGPGG